MASLNAYRGRLYLLGRFPAKDGSAQLKQARITLSLEDTPANRRVAEKRLAVLNKQLERGSFSWEDWLDAPPQARCTWRQAIAMLYRKKVTLGRTKASTWEVNYMGHLRQLDPSEAVSTDAIERAISRYGREQYSYKLLYYLMRDIAALTGTPYPEVGVPLYSSKRVNLKQVPSDAEVIAWVLDAGQPYQWFFGMMATYGLRPHEVEACEQIDGGYVQVRDDTKTGFRTVVPLERDWVERFGLAERQVMPASVRSDRRPDACSQWLNKRRLAMQLPWTAYALRHAYAGRLWRHGGVELDLFTAAKLMGHSIDEHVKTYRAFVDPNQIAAQAEAAFERQAGRIKAQLNGALGQAPQR